MQLIDISRIRYLSAQLMLVFLVLVVGEPLFALDPSKPITQYGHDVWDAKNGFTQFVINTMLQTTDGYLWLGTDEGLVRFDGVQFTTFDKSTTKEILQNDITALCEDRDRNLWIGTRAGGLLKYRSGTFARYSLHDGLPTDSVLSLCLDHTGSLWIGLNSSGLFQFKDGAIVNVPVHDQVFRRAVAAICEKKDGTMLFGVGDLGMKSAHSDTFIHVYTGEDHIFSLCEDSKGTVWIGKENGLYYYKNGIVHQFFDANNRPIAKVRSVYEDHAGNLWIGTEGQGIYRMTNEVVEQMTIDNGLSSDRVFSLCEDREGNLWVGTRGGGLMRLKDRPIVTYGAGQGISNLFVSTIIQARDSSFWIGTRGGGVYHMINTMVTKSFTTNDHLADDQVRGLCEDRDGSILVGTVSKLQRIRRRVEEILPVSLSDHPHANVRAIHVDKNGNTWIGTYGPGLFRLSGEKFSKVPLVDAKESQIDFIRLIVEDRHGTLWIGTHGGLVHLNDTITTIFTMKEGLPSDDIFAITEDEQGTLWIGTYGGGLSRFKDGTFTAYRKRDGLFDDVVFTILDDGQGNFWMSSNKGIFRVAKRQLEDFAAGKISSITSTSFGVVDGMQSVECNGGSQPSGWKTFDGKLLFPTVKGIAVVDPRRVHVNQLPPPVSIEQVVTETETLSVLQNVTLARGVRTFEIQYAGLSLSVPEKVRFKFKLDGFDEHWIEAGTRRKAYYTNVPPGNYRFTVAACNSDGVWNLEGAAVGIAIPPYLWETGWFRAAGAFISVGLILFVVKRRENTIKAEAKKKIAIQRQIVELESRALRSQMNPHFMFNSLNAIQECILSNNTEAACNYLSRFAQLLRTILEHSELPFVTLDQEITALKLYLELEALRFDKRFISMIDVDSSLDPMKYRIPAMLIQPYVENAIWHGLLPKEGERRLVISMKHDGGRLLCTVEDNGIGRERASMVKHPLKRNHESKGMNVTRERLDIMNKESGADASVLIIDLFDEGHQPRGTCVELRIPLNIISPDQPEGQETTET